MTREPWLPHTHTHTSHTTEKSQKRTRPRLRGAAHPLKGPTTENKSYAVLRGALLLATHRFSFSSFFAGHRLSNRSAEMTREPWLPPVYPTGQFIQRASLSTTKKSQKLTPPRLRGEVHPLKGPPTTHHGEQELRGTPWWLLAGQPHTVQDYTPLKTDATRMAACGWQL